MPTANCPLPTLFLLIAILLSGLTARSQITPAYQVKAAFLYNFSQFVEWPPSAYESGRAPFVIGILGDNPFGTYLEELVKDEKVGSRPIVIKKYKDVGDVKGCHILYINLPKAAEAVRSLNHRGILTVSDADDFAKEGGMVRFYTQNNKIRLQVNLTAVKSANIEVSSKLLRVSDIIE